VGIELEGADTTPYTLVQYRMLADLIGTLRKGCASLRTAPVVGHSDIAPERKTDPGDAFDWGRLERLIGRLT
jgi:AmpD protein